MSNFSRILQAHSSPQESISTIMALLGSPSALNALEYSIYLSIGSPHIYVLRYDKYYSSNRNPSICFFLIIKSRHRKIYFELLNMMQQSVDSYWIHPIRK